MIPRKKRKVMLLRYPPEDGATKMCALFASTVYSFMQAWAEWGDWTLAEGKPLKEKRALKNEL